MKDKAILLLALALLSVSCKTSKVCTSDSRTESTHTEVHKSCTSDSRTESTHTEVHKSDSVKTSHVEQTARNDSIVIETTIEKETVITIDLDGKEIYRETNCNTTTNRDHFRDTKKKVEDKEEVKHEESQKNDSTLIQNHSEEKVIIEEPSLGDKIRQSLAENHSEEKVIIEEPSLGDKIRQSLADCIMWGFGLFVLILISYHYYKKWQEKKEQ